MRPRRRLKVVAAVVALAVAAGASAAEPKQRVPLPSPGLNLTSSPPLQAAAALFELQLPGRARTRQRVDVGIDTTGAPVSVEATQLVLLSGKGDYSFAVPAPVEDVVAAAGSDSEPGLRQNAILWQGFSPGKRVLGARARLRVHDASPSLPVRLTLEARVGGALLPPGERRSGRLTLVLTLRNMTVAKTRAVDAAAVPAEVAAVLERVRRSVDEGKPYFGEVISVSRRPPRAVATRTARVEAPIDVRGTVRFPTGVIRGAHAENAIVEGSGLSFRARLGAGAPLGFVVRLRGLARGVRAPLVHVEARPLLEASLVAPPGGRSWRDALERGLVPRDGRAFLRRATDLILRLSRLRQYGSFLANPDALVRPGADRTVYSFRTAPPAAHASPQTPADGGGGVLVPVLVAVGAVLGAAALVVVWAHL